MLRSVDWTLLYQNFIEGLKVRMARSCGVELVLLILLGFAVGVLTYLYTGTKSDLDNVQKANQMLKQKVMESDSNTKTSLYKKNLAESTLKSLKEENKELQDRLAEQNLELKDMESRLVSFVRGG